MALRTAFTELLGITHPIALAPMGESAGGALAAAVSEGGGLGLLGAGPGRPAWVDRELPVLAAATSAPWGVGFQSWSAQAGVVRRALAAGPRAVMLSFGDPRPLAALVRDAGVLLILQVTAEAIAQAAAKAAIVASSGQDTERSRVLDLASGSAWPAAYTARTLGHPSLDRWRGREAELAADDGARQAYRDGAASGELPRLPVWAGQGAGLITDLPSAADLVPALAAQAQAALARVLPGT